MNQHKLNIDIAALIEAKDMDGAGYSQADIDYINQYEGSGGQGKHGAAGEGVLYEFYTPDYLVEYCYKFAQKYGYDGGPILEPSCGPGRMIMTANQYTTKRDYKQVVGFEINPISARIAELNCPGATIYNKYFETAFLEAPRFTSVLKGGLSWLPNAGNYSLVIGNPPYGKHTNKYSSYFTKDRMSQIDYFFLRQSLKLCKSGGLVVFVTASNFLRSTPTTYGKDKLKILELGDLIDAYRLPKVFRFSEVPTDILIFRRK